MQYIFWSRHGETFATAAIGPSYTDADEHDRRQKRCPEFPPQLPWGLEVNPTYFMSGWVVKLGTAGDATSAQNRTIVGNKPLVQPRNPASRINASVAVYASVTHASISSGLGAYSNSSEIVPSIPNASISFK